MVKKQLYKNKLDDCPLTYALELIGGKWRLPIIWSLSNNGVMRYKELQRDVDGITNIMLTSSLKNLEENGIVHRVQYMEIPPRVEYSLTEQGEELMQALNSLASWGNKIRKKYQGQG